jgi:hypothetical protein
VTFGFDDIDTQLRRLEQFLVYADDTKQEIATANLLVQRNIPVTFGKTAAEVINDTVEPATTPRIPKAIPAHDPPQTSSAPKSHASATPAPVRRAIPVDRKKKEKRNGE